MRRALVVAAILTLLLARDIWAWIRLGMLNRKYKRPALRVVV